MLLTNQAILRRYGEIHKVRSRSVAMPEWEDWPMDQMDVDVEGSRVTESCIAFKQAAETSKRLIERRSIANMAWKAQSADCRKVRVDFGIDLI